MGNDNSTLSPEELKKRQIREMDMEIKHKLGKGANYNMKIVIKGETNTGKTCLFNRLQRKAFIEDHISTDQIQIATIPWDYKVSNDRIKVEVWDVVDHGKRKSARGSKPSEGLKLALEDSVVYDSEDEAPASALPSATDKNVENGKYSIDSIKLDAENINVYKDANAVLFTMDPRKKWTFEYIERELPNVPKGVFVLILVNYRDCPQNQRVVSEYEVQEFVASAGKYVRALECSMKNCYGMKGVRCFFNLPFLKIKRAYIMQQLKENEADLDAADQEFTFVGSEQNYDFYLKWLAENRQNRKAREHAESTLPTGPPLRPPTSPKPKDPNPPSTPSGEVPKPISPLDSMKKFITRETAPAPAPAPAPAEQQPPARNGAPTKPAEPQTPTIKKPQSQPTTPVTQPPKLPSPKTPQPTDTTPKQSGTPAATSGLAAWTSKWFGKKPEKPPKGPEVDVEKELSKVVEQAAKSPIKKQGSLEDFVPMSSETSDADFWAVGVSDDDEPDAREDEDEDEEEQSKFSIAKDEEPEFDEPKEEKAPPKATKPAPVPSRMNGGSTHPAPVHKSKAEEQEEDEDENGGYQNFSDEDDKPITKPHKKPAERKDSFSSSWNEQSSPSKRDRKSQSFGNLPRAEDLSPKSSKPKSKYVVMQDEALPPLPADNHTNGVEHKEQQQQPSQPEPQVEGEKKHSHRHRHRDGSGRKHRHRDKGDRESSSGERRKHRPRARTEDQHGRPAVERSEYSGF